MPIFLGVLPIFWLPAASHNHLSNNTEKFNCEVAFRRHKKKVAAQGTEKSAEAIGRGTAWQCMTKQS
jgi:hypothetical protein